MNTTKINKKQRLELFGETGGEDAAEQSPKVICVAKIYFKSIFYIGQLKSGTSKSLLVFQRYEKVYNTFVKK